MIGYFADDFLYVEQFAHGYTVRQLLFGNTDGGFVGGSWRPLTMLQYWITFGLHLSAGVQHLISIALYLWCGWLLYVLLKKDGVIMAGALAVLWLLWPMHVEPVFWIAARADLLAAVCALYALIAAREKKIWWAVLWYAASLLSKEVWFLLPAAFFFLSAGRARIKLLAGSVGVAILWFFARHALTGFGVGGYSVSHLALLPRLLFLNTQALTLASGIFLFGQLQATVVALVTKWWLVGSFVMWGVCAGVVYLMRRHAAAPLALVAATVAPILLLYVPFVSGHASLAEQRYWFAPSIALLWLVARAAPKKKYAWWLVPLGLYFAIGFAVNTSYVFEAAHYENQVITSWAQISATNTPFAVFFTPDTYAGVHLLAAPYFQAALRAQGLPPPVVMMPVYSQNGPGLEPQYQVARRDGAMVATSVDRRFFSLNKAGIKAEMSEEISQTSAAAAWDGQKWEVFQAPVDNSIPQRY